MRLSGLGTHFPGEHAIYSYHLSVKRFANSPQMAVALFDIDGTLIRSAGLHHRRALEEAIHDVTGRMTTTDQVPTAGMLDCDIIQHMLLNSGCPETLVQEKMGAIVDRAQEIYLQICPDLRDCTCPGALDLLRALDEEGIPAGLVTGNLTAIAWKKMEAAGLRDYLHFGAFAEMGKTRSALVKLAVAQATLNGWIGAETIVSLIGDHPNDIFAARNNQIRSIAVCTGVISKSELEERNPDYLFIDMTLVRPYHLLSQ